MSLTENAERALLFQYAMDEGFPNDCTDKASAAIRMFSKISGLSESDACAAFAELEDAGMIGKE